MEQNKVKVRLAYLKEVCTEQEILTRLGINIYKYKKMLIGEIKESEYDYYINKIDDKFKYELERKKDIDKISIDKRMTDLLFTLRDYYSIVKIGKYVGVSDTHLHRIMDKKDKVKYSLYKLKKLEELYYGTDILKEEEISYYPHTYKEEFKMERVKKYNNIEKQKEYVNYDVSHAEKVIPEKLKYLRDNVGIKGIEIARRLDISNTAFHFAYKGKMPKNSVKLLNMIEVEFKEELK